LNTKACFSNIQHLFFPGREYKIFFTVILSKQVNDNAISKQIKIKTNKSYQKKLIYINFFCEQLSQNGFEK